MPFSAKDKANAAKREAGFRRFVYPNRVAEGRMTQKAADEQIALMDEITADYTKLAEEEDAKGRLL